jgi:hypothetical protein
MPAARVAALLATPAISILVHLSHCWTEEVHDYCQQNDANDKYLFGIQGAKQEPVKLVVDQTERHHGKSDTYAKALLIKTEPRRRPQTETLEEPVSGI